MFKYNDFCAFILTHGRPDKVHTFKTLKRAGYTGKIYIVIDDEDKKQDEYRKLFGDIVIQFNKKEIASRIDEGDNFQDRRAIIYARNACFDLAKLVGCKYFIQLDDDYTHFNIRFKSDGSPCTGMIRKRMDDVLISLLDFYKQIPALTIAMSQGGDFIGGGTVDKRKLTRKAMNTFICSTERPFEFYGRINEDVNTYVKSTREGKLFLTVMQTFVNQEVTQKTKGGMTELYLDNGTYLKTFYSVMYNPSCVKVSQLGDPRSPHYRIHHKINWNLTAPKILDPKYKKVNP